MACRRSAVRSRSRPPSKPPRGGFLFAGIEPLTDIEGGSAHRRDPQDAPTLRFDPAHVHHLSPREGASYWRRSAKRTASAETKRSPFFASSLGSVPPAADKRSLRRSFQGRSFLSARTDSTASQFLLRA